MLISRLLGIALGLFATMGSALAYDVVHAVGDNYEVGQYGSLNWRAEVRRYEGDYFKFHYRWDFSTAGVTRSDSRTYDLGPEGCYDIFHHYPLVDPNNAALGPLFFVEVCTGGGRHSHCPGYRSEIGVIAKHYFRALATKTVVFEQKIMHLGYFWGPGSNEGKTTAAIPAVCPGDPGALS